jgi:hypothetical protein
MTTTAVRCAFALAAALGAVRASATDSLAFDFSLHAGLDKYDSVSLSNGLSSTDFSDAQQLRDASASYGATGILRLGPLDAGAIFELGRPGRRNDTTVVGALGGLNLLFGRLQIDALAEVGGHRYGDALSNTDVITSGSRSDWLAYAGLRPGIAVHLGDDGRWLLGIWAFSRWDLYRKSVPVTLQGGGSGSYKLGGAQYGAAVRLGFSL